MASSRTDDAAQRLADAREHVRHIVDVYHRHSATSCPPNCRAMCRYNDLIDRETGLVRETGES